MTDAARAHTQKAVEAAADLLDGVGRAWHEWATFGGVAPDLRAAADTVVRAYLDNLDPAEVAQLASGDLVDWTAAVLKAVRP